MNNEETFHQTLRIPDVWQQKAVQALQEGLDVVVSAPTGAGKTYIFECLMAAGFRGQAVYTVPTRALANDKRLEWREADWDVGIQTGDRSENTRAPVVVATLETQKGRFLRGDGPDLLVIDEYQMIADPDRGAHYELVVAMAPAKTQLLFLSGSVGNPETLAGWLERLGRKVVCIHHQQRPVPLEEIHVDNLPARIPTGVEGFWPQIVARALRAEMAPLIVFTPQRKAAEELAFQLARMLPEEDPLQLTPEQRRLAGTGLNRLLRSRIAYHHSGLNYNHRAGLIEPLAKAGQLRVVVATMGLAAGINFSMRSVLVTGKEYRVSDQYRLVRPDELLQMFGRAGRRGLDKIGYVLVAPGKPRLSEARPMSIQRSDKTDWPSLIAVMSAAHDDSRDSVLAAQEVSSRLFSEERVPLGLNQFKAIGGQKYQIHGPTLRQKVYEIETPDRQWERKKAPRRASLESAWLHDGKDWHPALSQSSCLANVSVGSLCRFGSNGKEMDEAPRNYRRYGRELAMAYIPEQDEESELLLVKKFYRLLRSINLPSAVQKRLHPPNWTLESMEEYLFPLLPQLTQGGEAVEWRENNRTLYVRLDYRNAQVMAIIDSAGRALINPPERVSVHEARLDYIAGEQPLGASQSHKTTADAWYQLALIDEHARPTRRGRIFSYFNHGEGLAIAAALEDESYPIEELIEHLANLRAGHRFGEHEVSSGRLGMTCRATFGYWTLPGYLYKGLPDGYGDGAAEWLFRSAAELRQFQRQGGELGWGDVERAKLEWHSLLRHIAHAPEMDWSRWLELKQEAFRRLDLLETKAIEDNFPPLTPQQKKRHKSFLKA